MTVTRPTQLPVWAVQDQISPIGTNNVEEPPPEKQQFGWDFQEFPPRNWFNWLGRYTYQWLDYLDQQEAQSVVVSVANSVSTGPIFNILTGGLCVLWVVDKGNSANYFNTMAYLVPTPGSPTGMPQIGGGGTLSIGTGIQTDGSITITGGTGPYICWAQTKTVP